MERAHRALNPSRSLLLGLRCALLPALALLLFACERPVDPRVLRLGYFANITHAPALTGMESGRFGRALGDVRLEPRVFSAGPSAMNALLGGAIDVAYVGAAPAVAAFVRSRGQAVRIIAGAASGGALFVVRPEAGIHAPSDLRGKRFATPQLGNTQDVALRTYLLAHGLASIDQGGDVTVIPMSSADIFAQFRLGHLDGAWVPEPWASRLVVEAGGTIFLDERDEWPARRFASTVLVARVDYLRRAPANVARLLSAHVAEIEWIDAHGAEARTLAADGVARTLGRALPPEVIARAWEHVTFTADPLGDTLVRQAHGAQRLGFLPAGDLAQLVERAPLDRAVALTAARHANGLE